MKETSQKTNQFGGLAVFARERPVVAFGIIFVAGLLVGLALGWRVMPVRWTDAGPAHLHEDFQREWIQMAADSFIISTDLERTRMRIGSLGAQAVEQVEQTHSLAQGADQLRISQLQFALAEDLDGLPSAPAETQMESKGVGADVPIQEQESAFVNGNNDGGGARAVLPAVLGGLVVVIVMAVGGFVFVRYLGLRSSRGEPTLTPVESVSENDLIGRREEAVVPTAAVDEEGGYGAPVGRFMTTYLLGDDLYDDSFSVDDANGDFLGECGMGVSDTIGVGEPKKVCAFEIWLFDKNDVRTVTKVLMSDEAFGDDEKRSVLAPKGEPVMASPGSKMVLDTASLYVTARVVDMQYGSGALPQNSFFSQLTIELEAWKKT
jgi:hypothetical protein